jgi:hypothetical protein
MKERTKSKCDYCAKLSFCDDNGYEQSICESCWREERDRINEHHKNVGYSCYCTVCM